MRDDETLLTRTLTLVRNAPRNITFTEMKNATGVSVSWISRFAAGRFVNPGVLQVQALHDYLIKIEG